MNMTATQVAQALSNILDRVDAETSRPDKRQTIDIVRQSARMKYSDRRPALNMSVKTRREPMAVHIEVAQRASEIAGTAHHKSLRMAIARQRAARKAQFDQLAMSNTHPNKSRLDQAWGVIHPLVKVVEEVAGSKRAWATRFLGSVSDDIVQMAIEKMVLALANSDRDLLILREAAEQLSGMKTRTSADRSPDGKKERRELAKSRKWLMGMVNNRVMGALADVYKEQAGIDLGGTDIIDTVLASIDGVRVDPLIAHHMANQKPTLTGSHLQSPGSLDSTLLAIAISEAITSRHLDALTELILDNLRTDGAFKWTELAEAVFLTTAGYAKWHLVVQATKHLEHPESARAEAARRHVRAEFSWLPDFIIAVQDACALERTETVGFIDGNERASIHRRIEQFVSGPHA